MDKHCNYGLCDYFLWSVMHEFTILLPYLSKVFVKQYNALLDCQHVYQEVGNCMQL